MTGTKNAKVHVTVEVFDGEGKSAGRVSSVLERGAHREPVTATVANAMAAVKPLVEESLSWPVGEGGKHRFRTQDWDYDGLTVDEVARRIAEGDPEFEAHREHIEALAIRVMELLPDGSGAKGAPDG